MTSAAQVTLAILWTVAMTVTSCLAGWEIWQIRLDLRYIDENKWNGPMHIVVHRDTMGNVLRLSVASTGALVGVFTLWIPGSTFLKVYFTIWLVWAASALMLNGSIDRRARHYVALAEGHGDNLLPSARRAAAVKHPAPFTHSRRRKANKEEA